MSVVNTGTTRPWTFDVPYQQPWFTYSTTDQQWRSSTNTETDTSTNTNTNTARHENDRFTLVAWNIDFNLPVAEQRMYTALKQVEKIVANSVTPCVIFFQEMIASDLRIIQAQPWVQSNYILSDISTEHWETGEYGTCTLVSKQVGNVSSVFRVHYGNTTMERDALFVDIRFRGNNEKLIRFCNSHLESFKMIPPKRPNQLKTAAKYMNDRAGGVHASVLGGDLNAIEDFDKIIPEINGLQDAYLVSGGQDHDLSGCTWGQMARTATRNQFGLGRLDKILFCGDDIRVAKFELFGLGVEVPCEEDRKVLIREGLEGGWVTDHLGLMAEFVVGLSR